jgi:hypothetical protein
MEDIMNQNGIENIVEKINSYLSSKLWMDFEFKVVYYASLLFDWKTDTSVQVLELVSGYEAAEINSRFKIEGGTYIFKFYPEDYSSDVGCYVCAKKISYTINEK